MSSAKSASPELPLLWTIFQLFSCKSSMKTALIYILLI
ncbi:hypothetical protein UF72_2675 [Staphylococcus equorum subsp. equorum]|nr:hypothetical protein UF72_2675 [Staphylococcus equorum subsp. equorum]